MRLMASALESGLLPLSQLLDQAGDVLSRDPRQQPMRHSPSRTDQVIQITEGSCHGLVHQAVNTPDDGSPPEDDAPFHIQYIPDK